MDQEKLLKYIEEKHKESMEKADIAVSNWRQGFECGRTNFAFELMKKIKYGEFK